MLVWAAKSCIRKGEEKKREKRGGKGISVFCQGKRRNFFREIKFGF